MAKKAEARRRPLTKAVLRGLNALVELGEKDLEGPDGNDWLAPNGTFSDTSRRDVGTAIEWLRDARRAKGMS